MSVTAMFRQQPSAASICNSLESVAMLYIKRQKCLPVESAWVRMPPLRLGKVPSGLGTADLFVTIEDDDAPIVRVDLYADQSPFVKQDAMIWGERGFVGFGNSVYIIDPKARSGSVIRLGSYFAGFYATKECLLVASGCDLLRFSPAGEVLWKTSGLALDGVIVKRIDEDRVTGEGEWEPPDGWKPFVLRLDSGTLVLD
jgi:hypothetical protein